MEFPCQLSISGQFDAMNAEFDPEKNKVEVVVTPRYELTDAVAHLRPVYALARLKIEVVG